MSAVAGGPTYLVDYTALATASVSKPLVRLVQQTAQSIASNTDVAVTFGASSEDTDTNGFHDTGTNTSRITPTVAGYYRLTGMVTYAADTDLVDYYAVLAKNGTAVQRARTILASTATTSTSRTISVTGILQANGSTDYFELMARQLQAAAASLNTNAPGTTSPVFEAEFLRPL